LSPDDFGVIVVITVFSTFFSMIANMGFSTAIIQNKDLNKADIDNIYSFTVYLSFIIALIFALCLLNGAFKSLSNNFTTIFTLGIFAVVTYLMDSIIQDLTIILIAAMIGYALYLIINSFGKRDLDYVKEFTNERARMDARNEARSLDGSV
jgi:O-antigen/teichoic acid export membrane protein